MKFKGASAVVLSGFLFFSGCGFKNNPVPPENVVPKAVDDLSYSIEGNQVTLRWSYPVKNIAGTDLTDISGFELSYGAVDAQKYCATCPIPFTRTKEVDGGAVESEGKRRKTEYTIKELEKNYRYFFKVRSRTSWWADSDDSNIVSFIWLVQTKAPEVEVEAGDQQIRLGWQQVTRLVDDSVSENPVAYQVLRSDDGKEFKNIGELLDIPGFVDRMVVNDTLYSYKIQSVQMLDGEAVAGSMSEAVSATPKDMTPPVAPAGVRVVESGVGNRIFWEPVTGDDVVGYRVYRRYSNEDEPVLIGEVRSLATIYTDSDAVENRRAYYSVTAIDNAEPPNESAFSREATDRD